MAMASSYSTFRFLNRRSSVSRANVACLSSCSLMACLIFAFALDVRANVSQSRLGYWLALVSISTWSPLWSLVRMGTFLPLIFPPEQCEPMLVWIL